MTRPVGDAPMTSSFSAYGSTHWDPQTYHYQVSNLASWTSSRSCWNSIVVWSPSGSVRSPVACIGARSALCPCLSTSHIRSGTGWSSPCSRDSHCYDEPGFPSPERGYSWWRSEDRKLPGVCVIAPSVGKGKQNNRYILVYVVHIVILYYFFNQFFFLQISEKIIFNHCSPSQFVICLVIILKMTWGNILFLYDNIS